MITFFLALALAAALQFAGWWLVALIACLWGVMLRSSSWPALRIAVLVAALGAVRLGVLAWKGAPVVEAGALTAAITTLPVAVVWAMALLLPALVALCAAVIGAALGRRFMFG